VSGFGAIPPGAPNPFYFYCRLPKGRLTPEGPYLGLKHINLGQGMVGTAIKTAPTSPVSLRGRR